MSTCRCFKEIELLFVLSYIICCTNVVWKNSGRKWLSSGAFSILNRSFLLIKSGHIYSLSLEDFGVISCIITSETKEADPHQIPAAVSSQPPVSTFLWTKLWLVSLVCFYFHVIENKRKSRYWQAAPRQPRKRHSGDDEFCSPACRASVTHPAAASRNTWTKASTCSSRCWHSCRKGTNMLLSKNSSALWAYRFCQHFIKLKYSGKFCVFVVKQQHLYPVSRNILFDNLSSVFLCLCCSLCSAN